MPQIHIPVCCSTGVFLGRPNGRDYRLFAKFAPQIECEGFELMFFPEWFGHEDELARELLSTKQKFCSVHAAKDIGDDFSGPIEGHAAALARFESCCRVAAMLGAPKVVLHLWGPPESDANIEQNFALYAKAAAIAARHGVVAAVENIVCRDGDPLTYVLQLAGRFPNAKFTFDTRMAAFHKQFDDSCFGRGKALWENGRFAHLHFSDYSGGLKDWSRIRVILQPGEGETDLYALGRRLQTCAYSGVAVLESPSLPADGNPDIVRINKSLEILRRTFEIR